MSHNACLKKNDWTKDFQFVGNGRNLILDVRAVHKLILFLITQTGMA